MYAVHVYTHRCKSGGGGGGGGFPIHDPHGTCPSMRCIHAAHHTACRVLLEKKFPKVFSQVWSLLFSIIPSRCVAAGCSNTTKDGVSLHRFLSDPKYRRIWTTEVKLTRAKWSRLMTEHSFLCSVHFESDMLWERAFHSQFGMAYKAMLLPDAIPTIFPLSKKAVRCFFKARKTQGKWLFSNTPMHNPVHFRAKTVYTMLTVSVFTAWKHAVIFHINKTSFRLLYPGKTNIKTLNLSHYARACFEFWLNSFCYFIK